MGGRKNKQTVKIIKSFLHAFNGIKICLSSEINFRIHVVAAIGAAAAGIWLHISNTEWMLVFFCIALVLVTEMLNTAIEKMCDFIHKDFHPVIKQIKDIAAGAAVIAALISAGCAIIIFLPKLFTLLK